MVVPDAETSILGESTPGWLTASALIVRVGPTAPNIGSMGRAEPKSVRTACFLELTRMLSYGRVDISLII